MDRGDFQDRGSHEKWPVSLEECNWGEWRDLPDGWFVNVGTQTEVPETGPEASPLSGGASPSSLSRRRPGALVDASTQTDGTVAKPPLCGQTTRSMRDTASVKSSDAHTDRSSMSMSGDGANEVKTTSRRRRLAHIKEAMKHWTLKRGHIFCCPFHQAVMALEGLVDKLQHEPCNPLWSTYIDWECRKCHSVNPMPAKVCGVCGHKAGPSRSSKPKPAIDNGDAQTFAWMRPSDRQLLKVFPETPLESCLEHFLLATRHWNTKCLPEDSCCSTHANALIMLTLADLLDQGDCFDSEEKLSGWSCPTCLCLNKESPICAVCGDARPDPAGPAGAGAAELVAATPGQPAECGGPAAAVAIKDSL